MKKTLVICVILLFLGIAITPTIGISNNDDTTPPVTSISFNPEFPTGLNDWYVNPVTVTLVATDDMSGVNITYYSVNSEPWEVYDEPILFDWDDLFHIIYFSVDNAGNMEFPKLATVKLDQTPPFVNLTVKIIGGGLQGYDAINTAIAFDYMSGMERVEFYVDDELSETVIGSGPIYQWIFTLYESFRIVKAEAFDQSGLSASVEVIPEVIYERYFNRFPLLRLILQPIINIRSRGMKYA